MNPDTKKHIVATCKGPTEYSNWVTYPNALEKGRILMTAYPYRFAPTIKSERDAYPSRSDFMEQLRAFPGGVTYICLQEKSEIKRLGLPTYWCKDSVDKLLQTTQIANFAFENDLEIPDVSVTDDNKVYEYVSRLYIRYITGENMAIHCLGGHGRTGTIGAILLGFILVGNSIVLKANELLATINCCHDQRAQLNGWNECPQTWSQRSQVQRLYYRRLKDCGIDYEPETLALSASPSISYGYPNKWNYDETDWTLSKGSNRKWKRNQQVTYYPVPTPTPATTRQELLVLYERDEPARQVPQDLSQVHGLDATEPAKKKKPPQRGKVQRKVTPLVPVRVPTPPPPAPIRKAPRKVTPPPPVPVLASVPAQPIAEPSNEPNPTIKDYICNPLLCLDGKKKLVKKQTTGGPPQHSFAEADAPTVPLLESAYANDNEYSRATGLLPPHFVQYPLVPVGPMEPVVPAPLDTSQLPVEIDLTQFFDEQPTPAPVLAGTAADFDSSDSDSDSHAGSDSEYYSGDDCEVFLRSAAASVKLVEAPPAVVPSKLTWHEYYSESNPLSQINMYKYVPHKKPNTTKFDMSELM